MEDKDFYEMGDIVEMLLELQDRGVDLDSLPLDMTLRDLAGMSRRELA